MSWETNTYGAGPLFGPSRERRAHEEQIEAKAREGFYPASELSREIKLLLLLCVSILFLLGSVWCVVVSNELNPFYVRMSLLFIV